MANRLNEEQMQQVADLIGQMIESHGKADWSSIKALIEAEFEIKNWLDVRFALSLTYNGRSFRRTNSILEEVYTLSDNQGEE